MKHLYRLLTVLVIALLVVAALPVSAQEAEGPPRTGFRPDAPPYGVRGPYPVGFTTFSDGIEARRMEGGIWYPAVNPEGVEEAIIYDWGVADLLPMLSEWPGRAILDAEPDTAGGPYPLVISSHGLNGTPYFTSYLYEHLASYGFVVMAMNHPGNTARDSLLAQTEEQQVALRQAMIDSLVLRPRDITQTLDYAAVLAGPEGDMAGVIDMDRVVALGLSYGGFTAVMAGGAQLDFSSLAELCAQGVYASILTDVMCKVHSSDLPAMEAHLLEVAGVNAAPGRLWPSLGDPRIDAIVALMPGGGTPLVSEEGFASVQVPLLILRAGNDQVAIPQYNADRAWLYSGSPVKIMVTLEHAGHVVLGRCSPAMAAAPANFGNCFDPVWDKDRANDLADHFVTAFLLAEMYGDADAAAALAPDAVQFPGITYETTMGQ